MTIKQKTPATRERILRLALTTEETAAALGLRPTTIWRLTQRGLLSPNRATRRPLYLVSDIERFLQEGKA
jgi:hypothetical protein